MSSHWLSRNNQPQSTNEGGVREKSYRWAICTYADRPPCQPNPWRAYLPTAAWAAAIFAFTASRLKLAPFCIGGNSTAVIASFSTCCWTKTKRQNSYLNQSKYCCAPFFVPLSGQPVRSKGSRRKLVR